MAEVVQLNERRPPTRYVIHIEHHANGRLRIAIPALADDAKTRRSVVEVLKQAIEAIENGF